MNTIINETIGIPKHWVRKKYLCSANLFKNELNVYKLAINDNFNSFLSIYYKKGSVK